MKKIAILGAGWLGEPLAHQLQQAGHQVRVSTTTEAKAQRLKHDGLDARVLRVVPTGLNGDVEGFFTANILVLSLPPGGRRDPAVETNYPAKVAHIISAAKAGGIRQVLFTSSTGIYGDQEGKISEESPLQPITNSGKALVLVEQQLKEAYADQLTILRLAGLAGPDRHPGRWFAGKENVAGGNQYINLVHQADVLAMMQAVMAQNTWGHTLNVCSDQHPTKSEFYPLAAKQLGLKPPTFEQVKENSPHGKYIENSSAKTLLDFSYRYPDPRSFSEQ
jgi:nucleoside-diphosphate-sugar epimerase